VKVGVGKIATDIIGTLNLTMRESKDTFWKAATYSAVRHRDLPIGEGILIVVSLKLGNFELNHICHASLSTARREEISFLEEGGR